MKKWIQERIKIRSAIETDAKKIFQWRIDEELNTYDPRTLPATIEELERECEGFARFFGEQILTDGMGEYKFYIIANGSNQPIGYINLFSFDEKKKEAELGIMIGDRKYQGRGVAFFALNQVLAQIQAHRDLGRIYVETNAKNHSAIRLFERAGFATVDTEDWGEGVCFQTMEKRFERGLK